MADILKVNGDIEANSIVASGDVTINKNSNNEYLGKFIGNLNGNATTATTINNITLSTIGDNIKVTIGNKSDQIIPPYADVALDYRDGGNIESKISELGVAISNLGFKQGFIIAGGYKAGDDEISNKALYLGKVAQLGNLIYGFLEFKDIWFSEKDSNGNNKVFMFFPKPSNTKNYIVEEVGGALYVRKKGNKQNLDLEFNEVWKNPGSELALTDVVLVPPPKESIDLYVARYSSSNFNGGNDMISKFTISSDSYDMVDYFQKYSKIEFVGSLSGGLGLDEKSGCGITWFAYECDVDIENEYYKDFDSSMYIE